MSDTESAPEPESAPVVEVNADEAEVNVDAAPEAEPAEDAQEG